MEIGKGKLGKSGGAHQRERIDNAEALRAQRGAEEWDYRRETHHRGHRDHGAEWARR
jgi:hypothetical protein